MYFSVLGAQPQQAQEILEAAGAAAARPARPRARHSPQPGAAVRAGRADRERRASVGADPARPSRTTPRVTWTTKTASSHRVPKLAASTAPSDGILLLDKALGVSSNAALQQVRALFGAAKAGHAGSLDPLASGLLPVCFGQATKVCGRLLNSGKTYRVLVQLGARTESGDGETEVVERAAVPPLDDRAVDAALATFLGEQQQVPPMHSALKFEGKRLYELARRGESVEREPRRIVIHRIARVRFEHRRAGVRRLLLEGDLHPDAGRRHRRAAWARWATSGACAGCRSIRSATCPCTRWSSWPGLRRTARDAVLLQPDQAFLDLPRVELEHGGGRGVAAGKDGRGAAAGRSRASCGLTTARAGSSAWCRARPTGGSGRSGCSWTSRQARA